MADISLICPRCGLETVASEFASADGRQCRHCGGPLPAVRSSHKGPEVTRREKSTAMAETVGMGAAEIRRIPQDQTRVERQKRAAHRVRVSRVWGALVLILIGGGGLAAQWAGGADAGIRSSYLLARYAVVAVALALVVYDAFFESSIQGLLCLVIPFYVVYFALFHIESRVRRSLFISMLILLAGECWFLPNESIVSMVDRSISNGIKSVAGLIERAGEPDV